MIAVLLVLILLSLWVLIGLVVLGLAVLAGVASTDSGDIELAPGPGVDR